MALRLIGYDRALFFFFSNLSTQREPFGDLCMRIQWEWKEKGIRQSVLEYGACGRNNLRWLAKGEARLSLVLSKHPWLLPHGSPFVRRLGS